MRTDIRPDEIKTDSFAKFMSSKWQHSETEMSAFTLCMFAQYRGSWQNFTIQEIERYYLVWSKDNNRFNFHHLLGEDIIVVDHNPKKKEFAFTEFFIIECWRLAGNRNVPA